MQSMRLGTETISDDGGMGNLPYSTSRTTTNDERNLAPEFLLTLWHAISPSRLVTYDY
jgi:hypothetical protein